jgi:hypothetical protein
MFVVSGAVAGCGGKMLVLLFHLDQPDWAPTPPPLKNSSQNNSQPTTSLLPLRVPSSVTISFLSSLVYFLATKATWVSGNGSPLLDTKTARSLHIIAHVIIVAFLRSNYCFAGTDSQKDEAGVSAEETTRRRQGTKGRRRSHKKKSS